MVTNIKIVGTTFHPLPEGAYVRVKETFYMDNVPCAMVSAVLVPEPTNPYDAEAVRVFIPLEDGTAFCVGYLPKAEPLKKRISRPVAAWVRIQNYVKVNPQLSPSWTIVEVSGL